MLVYLIKIGPCMGHELGRIYMESVLQILKLFRGMMWGEVDLEMEETGMVFVVPVMEETGMVPGLNRAP